MKYNKLNLGTIEAIVNKLGGMEGVEKFLSDKTKIVEVEKTKFPVWKTIKNGTHKSVDELCLSIKNRGNGITEVADYILNKAVLDSAENEIELYVGTVSELTGKDLATNREVVEAIYAKGYHLCSIEDAAQLRLEYKDQPKGERLHIAMEPERWLSWLFILVLEHGNDGWCRITECSGHPDNYKLNGDTKFIFRYFK